MNEQPSFLALLLEKLASVIKSGKESGVDTTAAQQEVLRQIRQVSKGAGGSPISGRGVTKSGKHD